MLFLYQLFFYVDDVFVYVGHCARPVVALQVATCKTACCAGQRCRGLHHLAITNAASDHHESNYTSANPTQARVGGKHAEKTNTIQRAAKTNSRQSRTSTRTTALRAEKPVPNCGGGEPRVSSIVQSQGGIEAAEIFLWFLEGVHGWRHHLIAGDLPLFVILLTPPFAGTWAHSVSGHVEILHL